MLGGARSWNFHDRPPLRRLEHALAPYRRRPWGTVVIIEMHTRPDINDLIDALEEVDAPVLVNMPVFARRCVEAVNERAWWLFVLPFEGDPEGLLQR